MTVAVNKPSCYLYLCTLPKSEDLTPRARALAMQRPRAQRIVSGLPEREMDRWWAEQRIFLLLPGLHAGKLEDSSVTPTVVSTEYTTAGPPEIRTRHTEPSAVGHARHSKPGAGVAFPA